MRVKVQFALGNFPICMTGTVRSIRFNEETNRTILHIEAESLPMETRNLILGEVFGTDAGNDEDTPFSALDEEAASVVEPVGSADGDELKAADF